MLLDERGLHLHQSDLDTYMGCPEKLRRRYIASTAGEQFNSDAAFVGTTMHSTIEDELNGVVLYESEEHCAQYAAYLFLEGFAKMVADGVIYSRESFLTDAKALQALKPLVLSWYRSPEREELLTLNDEDVVVEYEFDEEFTTHPSGLLIWLAGRMDVIVRRHRIWDWKSSSSEYKLWEKQRWAPQPTVYTWAAAKNGMLLPNKYGEYLFEYKVLKRGSKPTGFLTYPVTRTINGWTWMNRVANNIATTFLKLGIEEEWPLNDHSALCSPKWCEHWDNCKGLYIGKDWT